MQLSRKKRCLIVSENIRLGGGPPGYLFHLRNGLLEIGVNDILFFRTKKKYKLNVKQNGSFSSLSFFDKVKPRISSLLNRLIANRVVLQTNIELILLFRDYKQTIKILDSLLMTFEISVIHFHDPLLLFFFKKYSTSNKKILLLTWHSPSGIHERLTEIQNPNQARDYRIASKLLEFMHVKCFKYADYFVVPSLHCFDGYIKYTKKLRPLILQEKIKIVLTGIDDSFIKATKSRDEFLQSIDVSPDKRIISFIGRGHTDKGYDLFLKVAKRLENDDRFIFLKSGDLYNKILNNAPNNLRILGWIDNVYDLVNATDVIMNPNRNCFFDILVLECLALGRIVLSTKVGGHIEYERLTKGVFLARPEVQDLVSTLLRIVDLPEQTIHKLQEENHLTFINTFRSRQFATEYSKMINEILKERHLNA